MHSLVLNYLVLLFRYRTPFKPALLNWKKRIYSEWHIPIFFNCPMQYDVNSLVSHLVFR